MYDVSAHGVNERMINVHYYYKSVSYVNFHESPQRCSGSEHGTAARNRMTHTLGKGTQARACIMYDTDEYRTHLNSLWYFVCVWGGGEGRCLSFGRMVLCVVWWDYALSVYRISYLGQYVSLCGSAPRGVVERKINVHYYYCDCYDYYKKLGVFSDSSHGGPSSRYTLQ